MPEAERGAAELLATASGMVEHAATLDQSLGELAQRLESLRYKAADVGAELRAYLADDDDTADGPAALEQVQERLAVLSRLARKHGGTIEDVLAHAERCREREAELRDADDALERALDEHGQARVGSTASPSGSRGPAPRPRRSSRPPFATGSPSWRWTAPGSNSS